MIRIRLLETRLNKGFSQEKLADLIGMSQSNYSRREKGLKKITDIEWTKIAKELGVQKEDIYETDQQTTIYKNIKDNNFLNNPGNMHFFKVPDFVLEHIELLKKENATLKEKLKKI